MKKILAVILSLLLMSLTCSSALAKTVTASGTVVSAGSETVTSPVGGTVLDVRVSAGDSVQAGDVLAYLDAQKIYALEDGTVRLFGQVGDSTESVGTRYGAVAYIEPDIQYTISASTKSAYDAENNRIVHPGEKVYLRSTVNSKHVGTGLVTAVSGASFTVEVTEGNFESSESVYVYRNEDYASASRIGKGNTAHADPIVYTGTGLIAAFPVISGSHVQKGDVLFETLEGSFAGSAENLDQIVAAADGVIASIDLTKGATLEAGGTVASFYADSALRIEATVSEADLAYFAVGSAVTVELPYVNNGDYTVAGTIEKISHIGGANADESESDEAWFTVLICPETTENLFYGMNVLVNVETAE